MKNYYLYAQVVLNFKTNSNALNDLILKTFICSVDKPQ